MFHAQGLSLLVVALQGVKTKAVVGMKCAMSPWKKNPPNWIKIQFWPDGPGFFFHGLMAHFIPTTACVLTRPLATAIIHKLSPLNKVGNTL